MNNIDEQVREERKNNICHSPLGLWLHYNDI
jgi:hypothetical protein